MRKLAAIVVYTAFVLLVGRNITVLPRVHLTALEQQRVASIEREVANFTSKRSGNYSILYASLKQKRSFDINSHQLHTAGSLNKVPIIAALYHLANIGAVSLDETVMLQKEDIQDYGTGSLRYQEPGTVYSLKTLARLALQQSDNTAAKLIATRIGMENIQRIIASWGLSQTDMVNNKTSLVDMKVLFEKLYRREITSDAQSQEFLSFMTNTDQEDRIPLLLPSGVTVYHKTADVQGGVYDVGIVEIVEKDGAAFFIGVMGSDISGKEEETKRAIAEVAKRVFAFEQNQR